MTHEDPAKIENRQRSIEEGRFSGIAANFGVSSLQVGLFEYTVKLTGLSEELVAGLRERYLPFVTEAGDPDLTVEFFKGGDHFLEGSDGYLKLEEASCGTERVLLSTYFAGTWSDDPGRGRLFISDGNNLSASLTAFENYFRWLGANLLVEKGGFIFHSAGVVMRDAAYLFFGHSGAGKSTVSEFSSGAKLLSDDLVFVFPRGNGYRASTTPFFGVMPQSLKEKESFPVKGCYRLRKSDEVKKSIAGKAKAFGLLVPSCPNIICGKRRNELLYPAVRKFLDIVPVYELFFKKDGSFWDVVLEDDIEGEKR